MHVVKLSCVPISLSSLLDKGPRVCLHLSQSSARSVTPSCKPKFLHNHSDRDLPLAFKGDSSGEPWSMSDCPWRTRMYLISSSPEFLFCSVYLSLDDGKDRLPPIGKSRSSDHAPLLSVIVVLREPVRLVREPMPVRGDPCTATLAVIPSPHASLCRSLRNRLTYRVSVGTTMLDAEYQHDLL